MRFREPVNSWSHLIGLVLAAVGTVALLHLARGPAERVAFGVYGGSLILLYAVSTLYHALPCPGIASSGSAPWTTSPSTFSSPVPIHRWRWSP